MDAIYEMLNLIEKHGSITFPITKMFGLSVDVSIEKYINNDKVSVYSFEITDSHYRGDNRTMYYETDFKLTENTEKEIKTMIEYCCKFVAKCKINKLTGKFYWEEQSLSHHTKNMEDFAKLIELFVDLEHVETILNKCSVCYDYTNTKLKDCSHDLCLDCLSKLTKKDCEQCGGNDPMCCCDRCLGLETISTCPVCREYILGGLDD